MSNYKYLDKVNFPSDIKKLSIDELKILSEEIEVELCAAPNGSYSLSDLFVKPDKPFPCLIVRILSFLPVIILCG